MFTLPVLSTWWTFAVMSQVLVSALIESFIFFMRTIPPVCVRWNTANSPPCNLLISACTCDEHAGFLCLWLFFVTWSPSNASYWLPYHASVLLLQLLNPSCCQNAQWGLGHCILIILLWSYQCWVWNQMYCVPEVFLSVCLLLVPHRALHPSLVV